ncbi:hypothetical protein Taro_027425 [Colocasia esculenta]|uniref:Protein kinase domain-containing protein n=1 Tax=Colocasia esculenta TaxID=4460 RepID=A0A843VDW3_COLES|nr:hypothetical protein [Colocasia esculenta]
MNRRRGRDAANVGGKEESSRRSGTGDDVGGGIAHIHTENGGKLVHGNIKSSNVFLNQQLYGCVSDVGLATLVNVPTPPMARTAGYRAPEVVDTRKSTQMSDVYSFGVLLLELLTGKSPIRVTGGGDEVVHLVRWVQSVVREEWTAEVFDIELLRYPNIEEEMVEMLQIAMTCVVRIPEQRPKIAEVVRMIEDVRRMDTGNRPSTEGGSKLENLQVPSLPPTSMVAGFASSTSYLHVMVGRFCTVLELCCVLLLLPPPPPTEPVLVGGLGRGFSQLNR